MAEIKEKDYRLSDLIEDACDTLDHDWKAIQRGEYDFIFERGSNLAIENTL